jgi:acyl carrier protein
MQIDFVNETIGKDQLRSILAEVLDVDEVRIKDKTNFAEDLGVDSLMALEVVVALEKKYQIKITEKELPELATLNDVYALLKRKNG